MFKRIRKKLFTILFALTALAPVMSISTATVYAEQQNVSAIISSTPTIIKAKKDDISEKDKDLLKKMFGNDDWENHTDMVPKFSFSGFFDYIQKSIAWNLYKFVDGLTDVAADFFETESKDYVTVSNITTSYFNPTFKNPFLKGIFHLFRMTEWFMLAAGMLLAIGEEAIAYGNGKGNIVSMCMNFVKAFAYCIVFNFASTNMYGIATTLGQGIEQAFINDSSVVAAASTSSTLLKIVGAVYTLITKNWTLVLALAVLIVILWAKVTLFYAKKVPQMLTLIAKGTIMPFFMARGNNSTVTQYLQNLAMFYLQIVLQIGYVGLGIALVTSSSIESVIIGIVVLFSINEVSGWIGGLGSEDDLGKMISLMHHANIDKMGGYAKALGLAAGQAGENVKQAIPGGAE